MEHMGTCVNERAMLLVVFCKSLVLTSQTIPIDMRSWLWRITSDHQRGFPLYKESHLMQPLSQTLKMLTTKWEISIYNTTGSGTKTNGHCLP